MEILKMVLETAGVISLVGGALIFLGKQIAMHFIQREMESWKSDLTKSVEAFKEGVSQTNRIELEGIKNKNAIVLSEYGALISRLSERRIKVIEETSFKLTVVSVAFKRLLAPFRPTGSPPIEQDIQEAIEAFNGFLESYRNSEIYFDEELCQKMQSCIGQYKSIHLSMIPILSRNAEHRYDTKIWTNNWTKLNTEIEDVHSQIKNEFRRLIGVVAKS
jgi:hypothetical protein